MFFLNFILVMSIDYMYIHCIYLFSCTSSTVGPNMFCKMYPDSPILSTQVPLHQHCQLCLKYVHLSDYQSGCYILINIFNY